MASVSIRPIEAGDLERETEFVQHLSSRTSYLRLMAPRILTAEELQRLTNVDPKHEIALVATVTDADRELQVGVARCILEPHGTRGEFAIVVADEWQRRGVGTSLLAAIFDAAFARGLREVYGTTLAENTGMLALARRFGCAIRADQGASMYRKIVMVLPQRDSTSG